MGDMSALIYALVGDPVAASLSPALHVAAFAEAGIDARYVLRPTPSAPGDAPLRAAFEDLQDARLAGANITVPHKVAARHLVQDESGIVTRVGAVNTIVRDPDGLLRGENTDASGFLHVLRGMGLEDGRGRHAVLLGAGGAARAVAGVLLHGGWTVDVLNRSSGRAAVLAGQMSRHVRGAVVSTCLLDDATVVHRAARAALLVNATPVGAAGVPTITAPEIQDLADPARESAAESATGSAAEPAAKSLSEPPALSAAGSATVASPWPLDVPWPADLALIDLIAWPTETALVHHARAAGAAAEGGLGMLVAQAAASFRLWTGLPAPIETMHAAATAEIARRRQLHRRTGETRTP